MKSDVQFISLMNSPEVSAADSRSENLKLRLKLRAQNCEKAPVKKTFGQLNKA